MIQLCSDTVSIDSRLSFEIVLHESSPIDKKWSWIAFESRRLIIESIIIADWWQTMVPKKFVGFHCRKRNYNFSSNFSSNLESTKLNANADTDSFCISNLFIHQRELHTDDQNPKKERIAKSRTQCTVRNNYCTITISFIGDRCSLLLDLDATICSHHVLNWICGTRF